MQLRQIETKLRKAMLDTPGYKELLRLHQETLALASSLAISLGLVPSLRLDKNQPHDDDNSVA
jgi:hypothetical protein